MVLMDIPRRRAIAARANYGRAAKSPQTNFLKKLERTKGLEPSTPTLATLMTPVSKS